MTTRILIITDGFPPAVYGGMATHAYNIARYLGERHIALVVTPRIYGSPSAFEGLATHARNLAHQFARRIRAGNASQRWLSNKHEGEEPFGVLPILSMRFPGLDAIMLERVARQFGANVVHVCTAGLAFDTLTRRYPTVTRVVGNDFLRPWCGYNLPLRCILYRLPGGGTKSKVQQCESRFRKRTVVGYLRQSHTVVANSEWTKQKLLEEGIQPNKVVTIVGGVDIALFQPPADKRVARARVGLPADALVLLTAASLVQKKGIDTVMRAVAGLVVKWPSVRYVVAGDGKTLNDLQKLAGELGLGGHIIFAGRKNHAELSLLYQAADVYVQISQNETMGRTYFEAGACGIPVIAAGIEGVSAVVRDNVNGLLVADPLDHAEIRAKIERLLTDAELRKRLGAEGLRMAREEFSWDSVGAALGFLGAWP